MNHSGVGSRVDAFSHLGDTRALPTCFALLHFSLPFRFYCGSQLF
jgi:hypothetical protein